MSFQYNSFYSFDIGFLKIQSWGLLVAIGLLAGIILAVREAKRRNENPTYVYDSAFYAIIVGLIFSRLLFFLEEPGALSTFTSFFRLWEGGLSFYGGFIGAFLAFLAYFKIKRLNFWRYMDIYAPSIAIAHFFGRIGCILGDGGHLGKITDVAWGALYNGEVRHLTAMYEAIGLLIIFAAVFALRKKEVFNGFLFSVYAISYGVLRFISDFYRADQTFFGLTTAQHISILMIAVFGAVLIRSWLRRK